MDNDNNALKQSFLDTLRSTHGVLTEAYEKIGLNKTTVTRWRKADPEFEAAVRHIMTDEQVDFGEKCLFKRMENGDTTAIIFYLKTKGKQRGYSEKALPDPVKTVTPAESAELTKAAKKKVRAKKDYIIRLLKKEGKYTAELSMQVTLAAQLMIRAEQLQEEMASPDYQQVLVEYSREGNRREQINPKEKLYMDLSTQIQRALRALGMNTDAKERKNDGGDALGEFMKALETKEDGA